MRWVLPFLLPSLALPIDPSSLSFKVYGAWMSKSEYCTRAVKIFDSEDTTFLNFKGTPNLGFLDNTDGTANGTYKCIVLRMSENIKFAPDTTNGFCTAGIEYTTKICNSAITTIHPTTSETSSCSASSTSEDTVFLYFSTASTSTTLTGSTNPFLPPTAGDQTLGLNLATAWEISGHFPVDFVVNANDQVMSSGSTCIVSSPTFSFVKAAN